MPTFASVSRSAARLRQASWMEQIQQAYLIFIGASFLMFLLPGGVKHLLRPLYLVLPLLPLVAKDLAHLPDAVARFRAAYAARAWGALFAAGWPLELVGMVRLDRALRRASLAWLLRRPRPQAPAGRAFTYLEQGSYRTVCAILLVSALVELPLDAAIVPLLVRSEGERMTIHLLMLAGAVSSLVYMLGDRWLVGDGRHVLTEQGLQLRVGARTHGSVPLDAIAACERLADAPEAWLRRHGIERSRAVRATASPFDKPNTVLILKADSGVRLNHMGIERGELFSIFLYLDKPQDLVQTLAVH
jgi:hypothetical protein